MSGRVGTQVARDRSSAPSQVRVLLGVPQLMLRQALAAALSAHPRLRLIGDVGTGKDALRWALEVRPDITLLDARLSPVDHMHAASAIHAEDPTLTLVTLCDCDVDLGEVDDGGSVAAARVSKRLGTQALIEVLAQVAEGEQLGDVPSRSPIPLPRRTTTSATAGGGLKASERVLLELLVGGSDNRALAEHLGCTEKTVRNRLSELYAKLHLRNRTQAALYAIRTGIADPANLEA